MRTIVKTLLLVSTTAVLSLANAQQVYRIVGPDGKVTFADKPPPAAANSKITAGATNAGSSTVSNAALPFELRQVVSKYPVTLYTNEKCVPCSVARNMLNARGIPFTEKIVSSTADIQALQRISGDRSLPFATIGNQQLKEYSDTEWTQFLNAAGYPASSALPPGYRQVPASPLVNNIVATPPADTDAPTPRQPPPVQAPPSNPAGITF